MSITPAPQFPSAPRTLQNSLPAAHATIKYISMGQFFVAKEPMEIRTVLGSCIGVCAYDPYLKIGGMNHFLTPGDLMLHDATAQYGIFAMEFLINELIINGAQKSRLEIKLFGGSNIIKPENKVGDLNCRFIREYVQDEKLKVVGESLGGDFARKICFFSHTGEARQQRVPSQQQQVVQEEQQYVQKYARPTGSNSQHKSRDAEMF